MGGDLPPPAPVPKLVSAAVWSILAVSRYRVPDICGLTSAPRISSLCSGGIKYGGAVGS
ncbi:hypothetical protein FBU59_001536 [Linderina macrospora]|uniref:Uncharacterized protein n=1 Tax=Linderina macrospora TaxID=4868 RepID=A0ACC1JDV0_9FUNG|nr:hypothetical protein FBU59_001536 [Linderina macrospora]